MAVRKKFNRLDYGQYLLSSVSNFTQTNYAEHSKEFSHDALNRWMRKEKACSNHVWEHVKNDIIFSDKGYLVFDDTVLDKSYSRKIELARRQYSGNAKATIMGIGIVTCVYVNPETDQFWIIDYRIYAPDFDGKSKLVHALEMYHNALYIKRLPFKGVLMDTWYATSGFMSHIHKSGKYFYCPIKENRKIASSDCSDVIGVQAKDFILTQEEKLSGYNCRLCGMDKSIRVKLFLVAHSTMRNEILVSNDLSLSSTVDIQNASAHRWKIEQFHRELKQNTGIQACQCRNHRAQRTHISVCMLLWVRFNHIAQKTSQNIYQIKKSLWSDYLKAQLQSPKLTFA